MDDRLSTDDIQRLQGLLPQARVYADYATEDNLEEVLLRSRESWEEMVGEAVAFPERLDRALERLDGRIAKLQAQAEEAQATLKSLGKLHPVPGTDDFAECEHEGRVAQLMIAAVEEPLQGLKRAKDSVPDVAVIM